MAKLTVGINIFLSTSTPTPLLQPLLGKDILKAGNDHQMRKTSRASAAKSGLQILKRCQTCGGQGAIECAGCKGTGKNKKNGNIFERWKCFDCQGFGLKSCPDCGRGGLTPEQRGER